MKYLVLWPQKNNQFNRYRELYATIGGAALAAKTHTVLGTLVQVFRLPGAHNRNDTGEMITQYVKCK